MKRVQLFATCLIDTLAPEVGECVVDVLEKAGVEVEVPEGQTCCGQPAFNGGFWDEARTMAKHTIELFGDGDLPVVVPSGSCGYMIAHHYPELFEDDPVWRKRAERLAGRIYELTQYLVDVLGVTDLGARCEGRFTYHASCHLLRGMKIHRQPLELLARVVGAEVVPLEGEQECCGFGGLFSIKYGDISSAMLDRKLDNIVASGAEYVVGCDLSCLLNINGGLHRRKLPIKGVHIAQLLAGKVR
ncbi:MAG: (Fe-S)-binding protein [Chloroflexota bacterium]